jgi:hypothetical protein
MILGLDSDTRTNEQYLAIRAKKESDHCLMDTDRRMDDTDYRRGVDASRREWEREIADVEIVGGGL